MVEWKKLGEVCDIKTGRLNANAQVENGKYPFFTCDINPYKIDTYAFDGEAILISGNGNVGNLNYYIGKFNAYQRTYVLMDFNTQSGRYLLHCLNSGFKTYIENKLKKGSVPYITLPLLSNYPIPIPSLSEQQRIVGILDTFTASIDNLKEQIAQRRKQYEYYRDQLLDLEGKEGVEMKTIGNLFTFKNGLNKGKEYFGKGKPIIMFSNVFNSRHIDSTMIKSRVEISDNELERINAKLGDVFFTRTSETKEDVGYASVLVEDVGDCTFAGFLIRARPIANDLIPEYCKYCFSTQKIRNAIVNNSSFTTRASLTGGGLSSISIPLPPLSEQQRIVSILDTFEASIQNLEAQLKQREKQYEYYRNKLLTFERENEKAS